MSNRLHRVLLAVLIAMTSGSAALAATPSFRILYHEKIVLRKTTGIGAAERVSFEAYGRQFDLLLQPNVRMQRALAKTPRTFEPLQGTLEGAPNSWARLTRGTSGWRGVFSDGHDIYAIEPAGEVADAVVLPLPSAPSDPIVYRLSDALLPEGEAFCETPLAPVPDEAPPTALKAFQSLAMELQAVAAAPNRKIRIGVVADQEFSQAFSGNFSPEEAMVARMNIVDGIFSNQVGVKIELGPPTVFRNGGDPFTRSSASSLLDEVRRWRRDTPEQLSLGITHLFTGRDLNGDTVGIAYLGSVCGGGSASSLSEGVRSTTSAALIAAHEIGHNFNAPHDGENGSACAATPLTFLMAPRLNGSDQFSACSLAQIQPTASAASCLTPYAPPDASIAVVGSTNSPVVDTPFTATVDVGALGDENSSDVVVTATMPAGITAQTATVPDGTCTIGAGTVSCALGTLASGESRSISLGLIASTAGNFSVSFTLSSSNDGFTSNNSGSLTLDVANVAAPIPPTQGGSSGGGGGGGGRLDLAWLTLLGAALAAARRRRVS